MNDEPMLTTGFFAKRLADLCLRSGMSGLPKDELSRHVLFTSMITSLPAGDLAEGEVNAHLSRWIEASGIKGLDHVTLRRRLADAGYLDRRADGTGYRVATAPPGRPPLEGEIASLDIEAVLRLRREEMARKKAEYLKRAGGEGGSAACKA